eukprot:Awhi_evm1s11902
MNFLFEAVDDLFIATKCCADVIDDIVEVQYPVKELKKKASYNNNYELLIQAIQNKNKIRDNSNFIETSIEEQICLDREDGGSDCLDLNTLLLGKERSAGIHTDNNLNNEINIVSYDKGEIHSSGPTTKANNLDLQDKTRKSLAYAFHNNSDSNANINDSDGNTDIDSVSETFDDKASDSDSNENEYVIIYNDYENHKYQSHVSPKVIGSTVFNGTVYLVIAHLSSFILYPSVSIMSAYLSLGVVFGDEHSIESFMSPLKRVGNFVYLPVMMASTLSTMVTASVAGTPLLFGAAISAMTRYEFKKAMAIQEKQELALSTLKCATVDTVKDKIIVIRDLDGDAVDEDFILVETTEASCEIQK